MGRGVRGRGGAAACVRYHLTGGDDVRQATVLLLSGAAMTILIPFAAAHFRLIEPQSWLVESNLGDPQKLGPCGGTTSNAGTPTSIVNKLQSGRKLHIKLPEADYHPRHYLPA